MPRTLKPANAANAARLLHALDSLRVAREALKAAGCPRTLARVRAAIRSAEGAERHMLRRIGGGEG